MVKSSVRFLPSLMLCVVLTTGCGSYQPTKNVWKGTKELWNTYVSPPASVDFEEKGNLSPQGLALTHGMMGIDVELARLERAMLNADKPPTQEWISGFLGSFPWLSGFAGVKYDGTILGQEPAGSLKQLDFIPLLYEDKKQSTRALRADAQNTPLGPEVLLASPLYDGVDFLGVVVAHFDMRTLMQYSRTPEDIVILSPYALLWSGKYDFASTPLAGVNWEETVLKSSSGTCTNAAGTFYYLVRYLGNLPLVFAVPQSGTFPAGSGDVAQGLAFFPAEREKLPPPPQPERTPKPDMTALGLEMPESSAPVGEAPMRRASGPAHDIQPGSQDSVLLREGRGEKTGMPERRLEGENVPARRAARSAGAPKREKSAPPKGLSLPEDPDMPMLPGGRPSPFGPRDDSASGASAGEREPVSDGDRSQEAEGSVPSPGMLPGGRPSPFGPGEESAEPSGDTPENGAAKEKAADDMAGESAIPAPEPPATLPDGRPSPFGPRD